MRVAPVGCTIFHAPAAGSAANATRAILTIRLPWRWVPEFRALMNPSDVDVFDFLRRQQTRRREQKEKKSASKTHVQIAAVSISEWKFTPQSAPSAR
jgi:hypothetical protein